jgi:hypothetical protein
VQIEGVAMLAALRRNVLVGGVGIDAGSGEKLGVFAAGLRVEDNIVFGFNRAIDLGGRSAYLYSCRVERNEALAGDDGGIVANGVVAPGGSLDVVGNKVATTGPGIVVGADAVVDSNVVNRLAPTGRGAGGDGIVVARGGFRQQAGHVRITGNRVHDRAGTGIALRTPVVTWMVKENVVQDVGVGIAIEGQGAAERVAVDNNEVLDVAANESASTAFGIVLTRATSAALIGNTVARVGELSTGATVRAGVLVFAVEDVHVSQNVVNEIGPSGGFLGLASGLVVVGPFEAASISDNTSRFGAAVAAPSDGSWNALLIQSAGVANLVRAGAGKAVVPVSNGAVVLTNGWGYLAAPRADHANVSSNTLAGGGPLPTCFVRVTGDVVAQGNHCTHGGGSVTGAFLQGAVVTASSNRITGGQSLLVLRVGDSPFAAVGNIAPGGTHLNNPGNPVAAPWNALNPTG